MKFPRTLRRLAVALLVSSVLALPIAAHAETKLAIVDLQKVFENYYKKKEADARLQEVVGRLQKDKEAMVGDYQKLVDETTKLRDAAQDTTLSPAARAEKQKAFETKVQDVRNAERIMQEFNTTKGRAVEDQKMRLQQDIVKDITGAVNSVGNRDKYNLILDKAGPSVNGTPVVLFTQDMKDITDDVIKILNATQPAASAASSSAAASTAAPAPAPAAKP
ncbi:periplasmic chaperone for outer membrane proteins Skp [Verrucomicrobium sp. GAS474]|uniref:OmpH family outer membrane protein n=1 Tax=Verrucomicrobium sp. GAS474 TaxID=1882831 RepID=UPI00087BA5E1|nr:OmpH family outer membrane protein [Verrucomicrobium sp. GAS474]SDU10212.1 periplasmic chaperone for outer membrane proteins Skp [Verrucomicrobium sp. GAS474]